MLGKGELNQQCSLPTSQKMIFFDHENRPNRLLVGPEIKNEGEVLPDLGCSAKFELEKMGSESSDTVKRHTPIPRSRYNCPCRCGIQRTYILGMSDETEIGLILWVLQIENVNNGIPPACHGIT